MDFVGSRYSRQCSVVAVEGIIVDVYKLLPVALFLVVNQQPLFLTSRCCQTTECQSFS